MKTESKQAGWNLWFLWIGASAGGMLLGFVGAFHIGAVIYPIFGNAATDVAIGICMGAGIGAAQWFVLKRYITGATWWWIPAGVVAAFGILVAAIGGFGIPRGTLAATGVAVAGGAATGVLQWLILRKRVARAGWWIPACAASWGSGLLVVNATPFGGGDGGAILAFVAGAAFLGVITGGVMVWLLKRSTHGAEHSMKTVASQKERT